MQMTAGGAQANGDRQCLRKTGATLEAHPGNRHDAAGTRGEGLLRLMVDMLS